MLNIHISNDGYKILQVEEQGKVQYIGSRYCQKREIDKLINECIKREYNSIYVIFGLGFAEHIAELMKYIGPESKILVIELNQELVSFCKKDKDINNIISDKRIFIASDAFEVKSFFDQNIDEINIAKVNLNYYCRYDKIYGDNLIDIYNILKNETERITTNRNTILHFGEEWTNCMIDNLKFIVNGTPINKLKNVYENIPAIIVSAGPSLEKNIDLLKNCDNSLILCGGRTLKPLVERNIKPDFLCVMDSGEVSYKLVSNYLESVDCPLVFSESSNSDVVSHHKAKKFFSANNDFISDICGEHVQTLSAGGSVSHSMTLLASYMGCNPIIFIGQDLAYTGDKGHASFAKNTWQNMSFNDYKRCDDIYIKDIYGEPVRTSLILNRYRIALQTIITVFPNIKYINATEGGANIEGTINKKLSDVLAEVKNKYIPKITIEEKSFSQNIDKKISEISMNIEKIKNLYIEREAYDCDKIDMNYEKVADIDKRLNSYINEFKIMKYLFIKYRYEAENIENFKLSYADSQEEKREKCIMKNSFIYEKILENTNKIEKRLLRNFKE